MSSHPIPIVDFTPFLDGSAKQQAADQLLESFKSAGFVYLTNFGIPEGEVSEMFGWLKHFFALSHETKMLAPHPDSSHMSSLRILLPLPGKRNPILGFWG